MGKFRGMGGSDAGLLNPEENLRKADGKLVRAMHHSLDDLENAIDQSRENNAELEKFLDDQKNASGLNTLHLAHPGMVEFPFWLPHQPFHRKERVSSGD